MYLGNFLKHCSNLLFPQACHACNNICHNYLCTDCVQLLNFYTRENICPICANPFELLREIDKYSSFNCNFCLDNDFSFIHTFVLFEHSLELKTLIYAIKNGNIPLLKYLAKELAIKYKSNILNTHNDRNTNNTFPDLIIPVPISKNKLYKRGYNQSLIIAKILSKGLDIPYANNILYINNTQKKHTRSQHLLSSNNRAIGLDYAINLAMKYRIDGLNVLLVDDVITTCATVAEISRILLDNGAKSVANAVLAKTNYYA
ncbi:MAG: hypothetical protein RLZZ210_996 [Pseudomonadota bacterium]|jgi:ComF family protein